MGVAIAAVHNGIKLHEIHAFFFRQKPLTKSSDTRLTCAAMPIKEKNIVGISVGVAMPMNLKKKL